MAVLTTWRLALRPPVQADLPGYLAYRNDPTTLADAAMTPMAEDDASGFLASQSVLMDEANGWRMFAVERLDHGGIIGEVGVFRPENDRAQGDIGWWFDRDYQRQGYATEAAAALIKWCFVDCGLHRVTASCLATNTASQNVMRRLRMRLENQSVESCFRTDRWHDEVGYALLKREWDASAIYYRHR